MAVSLSGLAVRCRGQQHDYRGAIWRVGQIQELRRQLLLQPQLCVQRPLGLSEWRTGRERGGGWREKDEMRHLNSVDWVWEVSLSTIHPGCYGNRRKSHLHSDKDTVHTFFVLMKWRSSVYEQYCIRNIPVDIRFFLKKSSALVFSMCARLISISEQDQWHVVFRLSNSLVLPQNILKYVYFITVNKQ